MSDRRRTVSRAIELIISELEEPGEDLTTSYVIGVLQEAIRRLEQAAMMSPAKDLLKTDTFLAPLSDVREADVLNDIASRVEGIIASRLDEAIDGKVRKRLKLTPLNPELTL